MSNFFIHALAYLLMASLVVGFIAIQCGIWWCVFKAIDWLGERVKVWFRL